MSAQAPPGVGMTGRRLWQVMTDTYDLAPWELEILTRACSCADVCTELESAVAQHGVLLSGRPHPVIRELRQQQLTLSRLLLALRIPETDERGEVVFQAPAPRS